MKFIKLHTLADEEIWVATDLISYIKWEEEKTNDTEYSVRFGFQRPPTPAHSSLFLSGGDYFLIRETPEEIFSLMDN